MLPQDTRDHWPGFAALLDLGSVSEIEIQSNKETLLTFEVAPAGTLNAA